MRLLSLPRLRESGTLQMLLAHVYTGHLGLSWGPDVNSLLGSPHAQGQKGTPCVASVLRGCQASAAPSLPTISW